MEERYQVIIVGGGPVGVALAVALGLRGVSCALVERYLTPQRIPKGQNLSQRSMENFYFWGVADDVRAARILPADFPIGGITAYGDLSSDYWFAPAGRESVGPFYFQTNERLPQYQTEEVLRRRMGDFPNVTSLFGWTADDVEQGDDGVQVVVSRISSEHGDAEKQVLKADYVVGCDGSRSTVREQMKIAREGTDLDQRMVLTVFRSRELHQGLKRFPDRTTFRVLHPEQHGVWQFFGRIDVEEGWFFHGPVPPEATLENIDFHGLMERAAGFSFSCTFDHIGFWDLRVEVAKTYRQGRAFVAGDAAHSHPPYGAFGLNSGLDDVANLSWKLAAVLEGWGGEALLDSYSEERRPIFWETGEDVIAGGVMEDRAFLSSHSPDRGQKEFLEGWKALQERESLRYSAYEPHYDGSAVVIGAPGTSSGIHGRHTLKAQPGHHLAPQMLSSGRNVFEELGQGLTLLAFDAEDQAVEPFQRISRSMGVPLTVIRDTFEGERKAYESRLVLVRPDQFVAWSGNQQPGGVEEILRKVTGR